MRTHMVLFLQIISLLCNDQNGLKDEYTNDGVHPIKTGYEVMAPIAKKAIARALILWNNNNSNK